MEENGQVVNPSPPCRFFFKSAVSTLALLIRESAVKSRTPWIFMFSWELPICSVYLQLSKLIHFD